MANICSNIYRFIFSDGEKAEKFLDFINSSDPDKSVYNLGVKAGIKNAEGRNVREWIDDSEISKNVVKVYSESDWVPFPKAWRDIARTFEDSVEVFYKAEEPGCGIFKSNDPEFVWKYVYNFWDVPRESEEAGVVDKQKLIEMLQMALGTTNQDLNVLLRLIHEKGFNGILSVHEIEYLPIDDWGE